MTYSSTSNLGLKLIDFDTGVWHDDTNDNWRLLDTVVSAATGVVGLAGAWSNSLAITVGQKFVDADDLTIWECLIAHTSPASGTFAGARAANPTYWEGLATGLRARGEWATGVSYAAGDLAYDSSEILYCVCATSHTSTTSMRDDIANWTIMLDGSSVAVGAAILYTSQTLTQSQQNQAKDNLTVRRPKETVYSTAGGPFTHTWTTGARHFKLVGCGGGGGGGGVAAASSGNGASAGAGSSGFYGETDILAVPGSNGTVNIGAAGAGATAGANDGSDGGDTTWSDGTNAFTFGGGKAGKLATMGTSPGRGLNGAAATKTGTIYGMSDIGVLTNITLATNGTSCVPSLGGKTPIGGPSIPTSVITADGEAATGYGAGGNGARSYGATYAARAGGVGTAGFLKVIEYF